MSSEIAQLPSSVVIQLASIIPKLEGDFVGYVSTLVGEGPFASAASKLNPILPDDAKSHLATDPVGFAYGLITATTPPVWETAIPSDVADYFQSVRNDLDSIYYKDVTIPPLPQPSLEPRPGSSGPRWVPISSSTVVATSSAYTVTTAPAGTGVLYSSGSGGASGAGSGTGTGRIVTPTSPLSPSVTPFSSASRWSGMIGAVAALMAVGVGALLLA